ncbi:hypothetical protein TCAL_15892 [Tigriopus californicus]|uniref:Uncharacterized protein n=1 Tax=Tigriopus californicus TaxID=6832 RepID=A0A553NPA1_TIGCA|nr:hypothetical protein TCAL_15892 [Tigriopus californicus]
MGGEDPETFWSTSIASLGNDLSSGLLSIRPKSGLVGARLSLGPSLIRSEEGLTFGCWVQNLGSKMSNKARKAE